MILLENFEFIDESEKAWQIAKDFSDQGYTPHYRWIPKSISKMNESKTSIHIEKWFYNVWMKEIIAIEDRDRKMDVAIKEEKINRYYLKKSSMFNKAQNFVAQKVPDSPYEGGYSNTATIYLLGNFKKYVEGENIEIDSHFNLRRRDLIKLRSFKEAEEFFRTRFIPIQSPDKEELSYLMVEFINYLND